MKTNKKFMALKELIFKDLSSSQKVHLIVFLLIIVLFCSSGADLTLKNKIPNNQVTYIFDNEPRNKEIVKRMYDVVEKDYNLVVWPDSMRHKDINDIIISGTSKAELLDLINKNTYSNLSIH